MLLEAWFGCLFIDQVFGSWTIVYLLDLTYPVENNTSNVTLLTQKIENYYEKQYIYMEYKITTLLGLLKIHFPKVKKM